MDGFSHLSFSLPNVVSQTLFKSFQIDVLLFQLLQFCLVNFIDVLYLLVAVFKFAIEFCDCIPGDVKFMWDFTVKVFLLFELFVILFVLFCDSLNFTIFLWQNRETILFKIFNFFFISSFDILSIRFVYFSFSKNFLDLFLFLLNSLVSKLLFFFDEFNSLIIFIDHWIVFHWPLSIESLKFLVFLNLFGF